MQKPVKKSAAIASGSRRRRPTRGEDSEQSREALPKNLIRLLPVQKLERRRGFGDLLSRSQMHVGGGMERTMKTAQ